MRAHGISAKAFQRATGALFVLGVAAWGAGQPIDLSGREVLFSVGEDAVLSSSGTRLGRVESARQVEVPLQLEAAQTSRSYGLFLAAAQKTRVAINGRPLDRRPLLRKDGALFEVPGYLLSQGANTLTLSSSAEVSLAGSSMFSLSTTEEDHFAAAFTDTPSLAAALPAADDNQKKYDALWYDITLKPRMDSAYLSAGSEVTMGGKSLNSSLQTVVLDFDPNSGAMAVDRVDGGAGSATLPYSVDATNKKLSITLPSAVPAGSDFQVRIAYHGTPNPAIGRWEAGYIRETHGTSNTPVVYTFSEPSGARVWWPCKDTPEDKATTTVQRITVEAGKGWEVVSNGSLASRTVDGTNETWVWENHHPIATYLVSMCISNYVYVSSTYTSRDGSRTMSVRHAIYPENLSLEQNGAAGTVSVINFFADKFGEYPFLDEKYYTASHNSSSGMEHQTATSMPGGDVQDGRQRRNVHELSHQWFGDKVTCQNFDELWLNEGFATICEALWDEYKAGGSIAAYHATVNSWGPSDSTPIVPAGSSLPYYVVYHKAGWVLHMLRHVVGDETFFQILRTWASDSQVAYSTAVSADFKRVAEQVSQRDLTAFFNQWLYRPGSAAPGTGALYEPSGRPTYSFSASARKQSGTNYLDLTINQGQSGTPFVMPVDIKLTDAAGATRMLSVNNAQGSQSYSLDLGSFAPLSIAFDPDNWVLKTMRLSVTSCGLSPAAVGMPYSTTLAAAHGRTSYTWTLVGGALPPGLALSSAGALSGTPTLPGTYSFQVQVRDRNSVTNTANLTLEVRASGIEEWKAFTHE